jgi:hypothetical protein
LLLKTDDEAPLGTNSRPEEAGQAQNGEHKMICPDNDLDCDNVGCRRGGCQGRRPKPPLFRAGPAAMTRGGVTEGLALLEPAFAGGATALQAADRAEPGIPRRELVAA